MPCLNNDKRHTEGKWGQESVWNCVQTMATIYLGGILMTFLRSEVQSFLFPCFLGPYQTQRSVRSHFNLLQRSFVLAEPTVLFR